MFLSVPYAQIPLYVSCFTLSVIIPTLVYSHLPFLSVCFCIPHKFILYQWYQDRMVQNSFGLTELRWTCTHFFQTAVTYLSFVTEDFICKFLKRLRREKNFLVLQLVTGYSIHGEGQVRVILDHLCPRQINYLVYTLGCFYLRLHF